MFLRPSDDFARKLGNGSLFPQTELVLLDPACSALPFVLACLSQAVCLEEGL